MKNEFFPTRMSNIDEFFQGRLIGKEKDDGEQYSRVGSV